MKVAKTGWLFTLVAMLISIVNAHAQNPQNWTSDQLIEPAQFAKIIETKADSFAIISVGPGAVIPGSAEAGMANSKDGIDKLKDIVTGLAKDTKIVIYCGCCPFEHCPNVRPAIEVLKQMKFTNYYLLNLPHNVKTDWIDKGFPTAKKAS